MDQLRAFVLDTTDHNIFWLHGQGNNGKTTMINNLLSMIDQKDYRRIPLNLQFEDVDSVPSIVVMNSDTGIDTALLEMLQEHYPQTRFIVESNFAPPVHLRCHALCLFQTYQDNMRQSS